jgi:epoxyqueuosine reductase
VGTRPELVELLELDEPTYGARFRGSPIKRAKRRGLARNAALALGNAADPSAIPALRRAAAEDPEPVVREAAAWALRQAQDTR